MDIEPKPVVDPKIFNVTIPILVQDTLRNKKILAGIVYGGGAWGPPLAPGLIYIYQFLTLGIEEGS